MDRSWCSFFLLEAGNRAIQRGITRPAREALFTVISREEKYKAKAFLDTFMYRAGDVVGAQTVGAPGRLGLAMAGLLNVVIPLALIWAALALWLGRAHGLGSRRPDMQAASSIALPRATILREAPFPKA